ncbi:MAG: hypothetical protein R6V54_08735, partial [Desulfobacteraceae bacterium]
FLGAKGGVSMTAAIKRLLPFILVLGLCGCAAGPDIVTSEKANSTNYSNEETRKIFLDHPAMISGDYFRQRMTNHPKDQKETETPGSTLPPGRKDLEKKTTQSEKQLAAMKNSSEQPISPKKKVPANTNTPKVKIGFLVDPTTILPDKIQTLSSAASGLESTMPVVLVDNDEIHEALAKNRDLETKNLYRTSGILTVYPGIRMLVLVETFDLPDNYPGMARAKISIVDSGLFYRYQPFTITSKLNNANEIRKFTENLVYSVFTRAVESSQISPWFCRTFSRDENLFYINAGKKTGLNKGDNLKIISNGKVVKSKKGILAGWLPGRQKGILRVEQFFGKDFAACSLVNGEAPSTEDFLIK